MDKCTCGYSKGIPTETEDINSHKVGIVAGFMSVAIFSLLSYVVWKIMNGAVVKFESEHLTLVWVIVNTLGNFMSATLGYLFGVKVANNTSKMLGRK